MMQTLDSETLWASDWLTPSCNHFLSHFIMLVSLEPGIFLQSPQCGSDTGGSTMLLKIAQQSVCFYDWLATNVQLMKWLSLHCFQSCIIKLASGCVRCCRLDEVAGVCLHHKSTRTKLHDSEHIYYELGLRTHQHEFRALCLSLHLSLSNILHLRNGWQGAR